MRHEGFQAYYIERSGTAQLRFSAAILSSHKVYDGKAREGSADPCGVGGTSFPF